MDKSLFMLYNSIDIILNFVSLCKNCFSERKFKMSCISSVSHLSNAKQATQSPSENEHSLIYVRRGRMKLCIGKEVLLITRPSVVFVCNLEKYEISSESDSCDRYLLSLIPAEAMLEIGSEKLMSPFRNRPSGFHSAFDVSTLTEELDILFSMLYREYTEENSDIKDGCTSILRVILMTLFRSIPDAFPYKNTEQTAAVRKVRQMLENELDMELSLDRISAELHLSTYYLSHIFKEITGYSPQNYRLLCRLASARERLVSSEQSIKDICDLCGFPDMSNFARRFKAEYGITPTEYRKNCGKLSVSPETERPSQIRVELL